jgi:hypothetical protein
LFTADRAGEWWYPASRLKREIEMDAVGIFTKEEHREVEVEEDRNTLIALDAAQPRCMSASFASRSCEVPSYG